MSAAAELGEFLTREEAGRLAASLSMDGLVHKAVTCVTGNRRPRVKRLLSEVTAECGGGNAAVVAVLQALSGVPQDARPQLVWTSPSLPGIEGHTTLAVSELINEAKSYVYAATYSAMVDSPYISALLNVAQQGVKVTLIVDQKQQDAAAKAMAAKLANARIWTLAPAPDAQYAVQHAKIVMIDGLATLITSANFSVPAAKRNLECGVLIRDTVIARAVKTHLDTLRQKEFLIDYKGG